jgi:hypothetical protein
MSSKLVPSLIVRVVPLALLLLASACKPKTETTYRASLRYIPTSADPYTSEIDTDNFIMIQLYYPLFRRDEDGTLTSEFLDLSKSRAEDSSFRRFVLCLKDNVKYSDGSAITTADLLHSLHEAHHRQEILSQAESLKSEGSCVNVSLKSSDPRYFEKLTGIASTVTSQSTSVMGFPLGLGPYHVALHSADRLLLEANPGRVTGSFKAIEYVKLKDVAADFAAGVFDFNHAAQVTIPADLEKGFQRVSRPFFKSYALVVNYPDSTLRKRFVSCFPTTEFLPLVGIPLKKIPGFLPSGIQGSDSVTLPKKNETPSYCKEASVAPITFLNYRPELNDVLKAFFKAHAGKLPIPIHYENGTIDDLAKKIFHEDRSVAVVGFDSSTSDSSAYAEASTFFESFIRTARAERLVSDPIPELAEIVRSAAQTTDSSLKSETYRKGHQVLLDSGYVIPLGQLDMDQLYPKSIKHIVWSDRISGFPDISQMEAKE